MNKLIQIIPINEVYAIFKNKMGVEFKHKVDLIGLDEEGEIYYLQADENGVFDDPTEASNFVRIEKT